MLITLILSRTLQQNCNVQCAISVCFKKRTKWKNKNIKNLKKPKKQNILFLPNKTFGEHKTHWVTEVQSLSISMKAINHIYRDEGNHQPCGVTKTSKKGQNTGIKIADHKILQSQTMKFTDIDIWLYVCMWVTNQVISTIFMSLWEEADQCQITICIISNHMHRTWSFYQWECDWLFREADVHTHVFKGAWS